jgi:hypothetical protein
MLTSAYRIPSAVVLLVCRAAASLTNGSADPVTTTSTSWPLMWDEVCLWVPCGSSKACCTLARHAVREDRLSSFGARVLRALIHTAPAVQLRGCAHDIHGLWWGVHAEQQARSFTGGCVSQHVQHTQSAARQRGRQQRAHWGNGQQGGGNEPQASCGMAEQQQGQQGQR